MDWLAEAIKGAIGAVLNRLFPPKTAADQRADDLQASLDQQKRMDNAAASSPDALSSLRDGKY